MKSCKPEACDYCQRVIPAGQYFERHGYGRARANQFAAAAPARGNTDRGKRGGVTIAPNPGAIQTTYSGDEWTICGACLKARGLKL